MKPLSLLSFCLVFFLLSCDPVFRTEVVNKTSSDILLEVKFDKAEIESVWQGKPYIDYIKGVLNGGGTLINFDTLNLVSSLKLNPDEAYILEGGVGVRPDFFGVKYIRVYAGDTLFLDNKEKMKKAFLETDVRIYQLIIK